MSINQSKKQLMSNFKHPFLEKLEFANLLKPGQVICKKELEDILDCKYVDAQDWNFLGKYLTLKTQIESRGYFVTQKDLEAPAFRILNTEEMAEHATHKLSKALCTNYKVSYIMATHNSSNLSDKDKKRFDNVQAKAAMIAMAQQKILLDEFYFD